MDSVTHKIYAINATMKNGNAITVVYYQSVQHCVEMG